MERRQFLFSTLKDSLLGAAACTLAGCGTIFHAERVGQPHSRDIDWKIVALDGLGLLLFFVPGVIAFIVDFGTGAIYLPPEGMGAYPSTGLIPPESHSRTESPSPHAIVQPSIATQQEGPLSEGKVDFKRILLSRQKLQPSHIEEVVAAETGCKIRLNDADARLSELSAIDHYGEQLARHSRDRNFGHSVRSFFSQIGPA